EESGDEDYEMLITETHLKEKSNRIVGYMENIANFTNIEFQRHFRLSFDAFEYLLEQVGPLLKPTGNENKQTGRPVIDPRKQLLSVIWILATPDSYRCSPLRKWVSRCCLHVHRRGSWCLDVRRRGNECLGDRRGGIKFYYTLIAFSIGKKLVRTSAHSVHTNTGRVPWVALNSASSKEHAKIFSAKVEMPFRVVRFAHYASVVRSNEHVTLVKCALALPIEHALDTECSKCTPIENDIIFQKENNSNFNRIQLTFFKKKVKKALMSKVPYWCHCESTKSRARNRNYAESRMSRLSTSRDLEAFMKLHLYEFKGDDRSNLLSFNQMQNASFILQLSTTETTQNMLDNIQIILSEMLHDNVQHLHNIKHYPKYN
ncbi:hypothetical protein ALC60_10706, partial [Trachymyrmex zeteki]